MTSRMFKLWLDKRIKTWNPFVGCLFHCSYCWARRMARRSWCIKCRKFVPHLHPERLDLRKVPKEGIVFISDMGDLAWATAIDLQRIIDVIHRIQFRYSTIFFFETKNPELYDTTFFHGLDLDNTIFSTTIETNREDIVKQFSKAPPPEKRKYWMTERLGRKHISIEPIMDFDPDVMFKWITEIEPEIVSIGYDNYNNHLPEPPLSKTLKLIEDLEASGIIVERKTLREAQKI